MKPEDMQEEEPLRFLVIQAVVTTVIVLALLMVLRLSGVTALEKDASLPTVEQVTQETAVNG